MFYGEYRHTIDNKGRLIIPSKFRVSLKEAYIEKFYVTRGLEKCLFVFTQNEWTQLQNKIKNLPLMKANARSFSRVLFSGAYEAVCDKQGRIMLPAHLIQFAQIKKNVVVVGVATRFEIWNVETWEKFVKSSLENYESIAEELVDKGLGGEQEK